MATKFKGLWALKIRNRAINRGALQSLEPERLVTVAKNLRALAVEQLEKLEESSKMSSRHYPEQCAACHAPLGVEHWDETPWYESGRLCWLWVALSHLSVIFFIGPRTKERLLQVISTAFVGWLVTDGYGAYRWYDHRQRCLAHLIRNALALSQAVDAEARQLGQWLLEEMRELINTLTTAGHDDPGIRRLQQVALLATASEHPKLKALANEILNDWQAVVAFVSHPHLLVTNNEAERALRHAVIAR
jgi:transposase